MFSDVLFLDAKSHEAVNHDNQYSHQESQILDIVLLASFSDADLS